MGVFAGSMKTMRIFGLWEKNGLVPSQIRRMVIDIEFGEVVKVYYECFADEKLLNSVGMAEMLMGVKPRPLSEMPASDRPFLLSASKPRRFWPWVARFAFVSALILAGAWLCLRTYQ